MVSVIKSVTFIRGSALNHREFVDLLGEIESEHGEIIYHANVRWLNRGSVLQRFFDLLKEIKLFVEKNNKRIEELDDEGWISDVAFSVDVTGHLNTLKKSYKAKISSLQTCLTASRLSKLSFSCGKIN
jgi:hypothetical protein